MRERCCLRPLPVTTRLVFHWSDAVGVTSGADEVAVAVESKTKDNYYHLIYSVNINDAIKKIDQFFSLNYQL